MDKTIIVETLNYVLGGIVGAYLFDSCKHKWSKFLFTQVVIFLFLILVKHFIFIK